MHNASFEEWLGLNGGGVAPGDFSRNSLNGHIVSRQRPGGPIEKVFVYYHWSNDDPSYRWMFGVTLDPLPAHRGRDELVPINEIIADHGLAGADEMARYPMLGDLIGLFHNRALRNPNWLQPAGLHILTQPFTRVMSSGDTGSTQSLTTEVESTD